MAKLVFSPSNLSTFAACPRRFFGQALSKELPWKASKQKSRGTVMHTAMEKALRLGWQKDNPFDDAVDTAYARKIVQEVQHKAEQGYQLKCEHEFCINQKGKSTGWWDDDAWFRARADVFLLPEDTQQPVFIGDIKTGRKWDEEDTQLRMECLLAHLIYERPVVHYAYWYIDEGESVEGMIDFRNGLAPVKDIYTLLRDATLAVKNNDFPPHKNVFCRWCGWYKKPECGL